MSILKISLILLTSILRDFCQFSHSALKYMVIVIMLSLSHTMNMHTYKAHPHICINLLYIVIFYNYKHIHIYSSRYDMYVCVYIYIYIYTIKNALTFLHISSLCYKCQKLFFFNPFHKVFKVSR